MIFQLLRSASFIVVCILFFNQIPVANDLNLSILFSGDSWGKLKASDDNIGGMARRAQVIYEIRNKREKVLLVDIGDFLSPAFLSSKSNGKLVTELMGRMKYDVITLGDHEFDFGMDTLKRRLEEFKNYGVEVVTTNLFVDDTTNLASFGIIREILYSTEKIRILFLGLTEKVNTRKDKVMIENPISILDFAFDKFKSSDFDLIICLAHLETPAMVELAEYYPELDIIIGLRSHQHSADILSLSQKTLKNRNSVHIVTASKFGYSLGEIQITINKQNKSKKIKVLEHILSPRKYAVPPAARGAVPSPKFP